jgi:anthranilate/para-aminobenzoate synthase component I
MFPTFNRFCHWASRHRAIPLWIEPELPGRDFLEWVHTLAGLQQEFFLLHSAGPGSEASLAGSQARYSYVALDGPRFNVQADQSEMIIRCHAENGLRQEALKIGNPVERFQGWMAGFSAPRVEALPPFWGGAVGCFGYESSAYVEPELAAFFHSSRSKDQAFATEHFPELEFGLYDALAIIDHARARFWLVHTVLLPEGRALSPMQLERLYRQAQDRLRRYAVKIQRAVHRRMPWNPFEVSAVRSNRSAAAFALMVRRAKGLIAAGEIHQCHLSQSFSAAWSGDVWTLYRHLVDKRPSPFAALWRHGTRWVASASPELLVRMEEGRVEMRPLMTIEERDHVPGGTWRDLLQACFPGDPVTGSPKRRAMEIIDKLEPHRRGPAMGSLGWIGFQGDMTLNVLTRTIFLDRERLCFPVGATVTADTDAPREDQKMRHEAQALLGILQACLPIRRAQVP